MKFHTIILILILCSFLFNCFGDSLPIKIDRMLREYRSEDRFSGTAMVAHEGDEIYYQGFGFLDRENEYPNTSNQMLKIGSIVKDFTAVLILQLAEQNKLQLDDNIGKYLDIFSESIRQKVTIRQLLRHEAGFGDYLRTPNLSAILPDLKTVNNIIDLFKDEPLIFEPGSEEFYSNSGYTVLGAIIERISGKSYFENVQENILNKLNMRDTTFDWEKISKFEQPPKWYLRNSMGIFFQSPFNEWPSPSGGAYSSGRDLLKFEWSISQDNRLINDQSKFLLYTRFSETSVKNWQEIYASEDMVAGKAGGSPGSNSVIINDFGKKYIIIVLANYDEPIAEVVGKNIHKLIKGEDYAPPKPGIFEKCYQVFEQNGKEILKEQFPDILSDYDFQDPSDFILNSIGYDLLNEEKIEEAVEIFTLNTELFPEIANTWDSLGEVYMISGDKVRALEYYGKSLELDPKNQNAKDMINEINKGGVK